MASNKFEEMLEKLVNEDKAGAEELFHEIVVEKSRDIYEGLLESDLEVDETKDEEVDEASDEDKRSKTSLVLFSFTSATLLLKSFQNSSKTFIQLSLPVVISSN